MMIITRFLSALMILALVFGMGQASQLTDCREQVSVLVNQNQLADNQNCDHMASSGSKAMASCHGFCLAPLMICDSPQPYTRPVVFAAAHPMSVGWRDSDSSPDPYPPKNISLI